MKIQNVSGVERHIPAVNAYVAADGVIDVADEVGVSLLEQPANWVAATSKSTKVEE